jgi:hypothetical protein
MRFKATKNSLHHFRLVGIALFFLLMGNACQKDELIDEAVAPLLGTWHQTSRQVDGATVTKDSTRLVMMISNNNICLMCDSSKTAIAAKTIIKRSGWSYSGGLLNIAIDLPASWYPVTGTNTLTIDRFDFDKLGNITKTTLNFERISDIDIE